MVLLFAVIGGCERELFPSELARTPYDRYLILRGRARQAETDDAFGAARPNLRARLQPLDGP